MHSTPPESIMVSKFLSDSSKCNGIRCAWAASRGRRAPQQYALENCAYEFILPYIDVLNKLYLVSMRCFRWGEDMEDHHKCNPFYGMTVELIFTAVGVDEWPHKISSRLLVVTEQND
ncbi:hypothetical protein HW555_006250 [Spodoptera exigua]|uniref:Uncharacterized protein n=1 Tax=Spodoptera exigua TaxID=7107 RepID=A0A835L5J3_SPOEX|nr:hypothetical protein HW555_006250 [Spodoptera exigua]